MLARVDNVDNDESGGRAASSEGYLTAAVLKRVVKVFEVAAASIRCLPVQMQSMLLRWCRTMSARFDVGDRTQEGVAE